MMRSGDTTATAGHDARWPIRAHRVAELLVNGARPRAALAVEARAFLQRSVIEDTLCAMENDGIVLVTVNEHLTRGERIAALAQDVGVFVSRVTLALSPKGRRFVAAHDQRADAGACPCEWCVELAGIRAWAEERNPEQISAAWLAVVAQIS